jgi:hypothetical protein
MPPPDDIRAGADAGPSLSGAIGDGPSHVASAPGRQSSSLGPGTIGEGHPSERRCLSSALDTQNLTWQPEDSHVGRRALDRIPAAASFAE